MSKNKAKHKTSPHKPAAQSPTISPFIARGMREIMSESKAPTKSPITSKEILPFVNKTAQYEERASQVYNLNMDNPSLWFSLAAWRRFLRASAQLDVEMAFYGIAASPRNPLYIHDLGIFPQRSNCVHWEADDEMTIPNHIMRWGDRGVPIERCARVLCHTHPGMAPNPSGTDEQVFAGVFKDAPWGVMCILSTGKGQYPTADNSYARLKTNGLVPLTLDIPVRVDMTSRLPDGEAWGPNGWESSIDEDLPMVKAEKVTWAPDPTTKHSRLPGDWGGHYPGFVDSASAALGIDPDDLDEDDWRDAYSMYVSDRQG